MKKIILVILACGLLSACGPLFPPVTWTKPGQTQQGFTEDKYACDKDTRQSIHYVGGYAQLPDMIQFFDSCMAAHGWSKRVNSNALAMTELSGDTEAMDKRNNSAIAYCKKKLPNSSQLDDEFVECYQKRLSPHEPKLDVTSHHASPANKPLVTNEMKEPWLKCLKASYKVTSAETEDKNAAAEKAFQSCTTEEQELAASITESGAPASALAHVKSQMKAALLATP